MQQHESNSYDEQHPEKCGHRSISIRLEAAAATGRVSSERVGESVSRGCPAFRNVQVVAMPHMGEPSFTRGAYSGHRPAFLDDVNPWSAL